MTAIDTIPRNERARLNRALCSNSPATRFAALRRAMQSVDRLRITHKRGSFARMECNREYERLARMASEENAKCDAPYTGATPEAIAIARIAHLI